MFGFFSKCIRSRVTSCTAVSNAMGSFQYHCSVASQMSPFADEPSSSGAGAKRPIRRRDMTALFRYLDIDIFATIRMVLKRVKYEHSNGILRIILSFFIRSIRQHKAVLLNVWN